jgi:hypothetical protein
VSTSIPIGWQGSVGSISSTTIRSFPTRKSAFGSGPGPGAPRSAGNSSSSNAIGRRTFRKRTRTANKLIDEETGSVDLNAHHDDFLDAVRTALAGGDLRRTHADIEEGHRSAALVHLGNIACRLGRTLRFDAAIERIVGDDEAHSLLTRPYRAGHWAVPRGV